MEKLFLKFVSMHFIIVILINIAISVIGKLTNPTEEDTIKILNSPHVKNNTNNI